MKKIVVTLGLLLTQAAFALTGVVNSQVAGEKEVLIEFAAIKALPSAVVAEVHVDHDTQDMTCRQLLRFPSLAQALISIGGVKTQENVNVVVYLSSEKITAEHECVVSSFIPQKSVAVYLERSLNPSIVISQRHINDVLTPTLLVLSGPANIISADLVSVGATHYTLNNINLPIELKMNFSVVETSAGSVSYLEHGQVILK